MKRAQSVCRTTWAVSATRRALSWASSRLMVIRPQSGAKSSLFGSTYFSASLTRPATSATGSGGESPTCSTRPAGVASDGHLVYATPRPIVNPSTDNR